MGNDIDCKSTTVHITYFLTVEKKEKQKRSGAYP